MTQPWIPASQGPSAPVTRWLDLLPSTAFEADSAPAATVQQGQASSAAQETDTALAASISTTVHAGVALEAESAPSFDLALSVGPALEVDTVPPLHGGFLDAGTAIETDVATASLAFGVIIAVENDIALPVGLVVGAGIASEIDTAHGASISEAIHPGVAVETQTALPAIVGRLLGTAVEIDSMVQPFLIRAGYSAAVLQDDPSAYFRLDDPAGATTAADVSGYGNDAEYIFDSLVPAEDRALISYPTTSLLLRDGNPARVWSNGAGDFSALALSPDGSAEWWSEADPDRPRTVEYWIQIPADWPDYYRESDSLLAYVHASAPGTSSISMGTALTPEGRLTIAHDGVDEGAITTTQVVADGKPHHVVVVYSDPAPAGGGTFDGRLLSLYVDGKLIGSDEVGDITTYPGAEFKVIGVGQTEIIPGEYAYFVTIYDEIALYDHALPVNRIFAHYAESGLIQVIENDTAKAATVETRYEAAVLDDTPSLYWRMDGEEFPTDASGNGRHADWSPIAGTTVPGLVRQIGEDLAIRGGSRSLLDPADVGPADTLWGLTSSFEFWFQMDQGATGTGDLIFQYFETTPGVAARLSVEVIAGGVLRLRYFDTEFATTYFATGPVVNDGRRHHVVATHDNTSGSSDVRLYFDGKRYGPPVTVDFQDSWQIEQFGVSGSMSGGGAGPITIDEVAVYEHELSAQRVFQHWMAGDGMQAYETDVALAAKVNVQVLVAPVVETDLALEARVTAVVDAGVAVELDGAFGHFAPNLLLQGSGVLTIVNESIITIPEFQLEVLDDVILRAPSSLTVSLAGGIPDHPVAFYLDGTLVWTMTTDTDGNLAAISLNITPTVGGVQGLHEVEARQTMDGGTIISATDTYEILKTPVLFPITMGADASPVEVPGALVGAVRHWVWQDLMPEADGGIGSWIMPIAPREMTSPQFEHTFSSRHTTSKTGQFHISQVVRTMTEWSFSGYAPDEEFVSKLREYRDLNRRFYIIDHHNRAWKVIVQDLEIIPRLRHTFVPAGGAPVMDDWGSDYKCTVILFDQDYLTPETP